MRLNLSKKIFLLFTLGPFLVVMLIMSIVTVQTKINTERKLVMTRLNHYAFLLESGTLSFESIAQKDKLEYSLEENILVSELIKKDYSTPYSTKPLASLTSLDTQIVDSAFEKNVIIFIRKHNSYDYLYPIVFKNNIIGIFHVNFLNTNIKTRIIKYVYLILFLNASGLIVSFLMIRFLVNKGILKGLTELMKGSEALTKGDLDYVLQTGSNDEIGDLAASFNCMTADLRKTTVSRDLLVKEVDERKKIEKELRSATERAEAANIGLRKEIKERKQAEEQRDILILDLQKALSEVKTLQGFLPICSHCKKIRDDKGYWNQIESYIHKHSDAEFSHSICPECAKKYYPDMNLYDD